MNATGTEADRRHLADGGSTTIPEAAILPVPLTSPLERGTIKRLGHEKRFLSLSKAGPSPNPFAREAT